MNTNIFLKRISKPKTEATRKIIFHFFYRIFNSLSFLPHTIPLCFILVLGVGNVWGQQSITLTGTAVIQNFNSISSSATATLPSGWRMGTSSTSNDWAAPLQTATNVAAGTSGTNALTSSSGGGAYNFANGVTASSIDRAIGFLTSSSFSSGRSIIYAFTNNTGSTVTSIDLSWNYEKYRAGTRVFDMTFFHGTSSTPITAIAAGNQAYAADGANAVVNPPTSINKSFSITGLSISNGSTYYLRWTHTGSGGHTNSQGIGIDDFSITLIAAATNYSVTFDANGGSGTMSNQTANSATNLTSSTFTRTGYTFAGWNTAANGSGTSYANVANFPFTSNTTLYAQWTANTLNVTYDLQGGAGVSNGTTTTGASLSNPGTPTRSGYNFEGWFTASNGGAPITFPYTHGQTSNFTLFAQWTLASSNNCPNGATVTPNMDQEVCENEVLNTDTVTPSYSGGTGTPTVQYQWYYNTTNSNTISGATAVSGATSALFTPSSSINEVGTRYYFSVAYASDNNCAQTATTQSLASNIVKVVVKGIPAAPTGSALQSYCTGQTVSNLNATGTIIKWYSTASGGSALNSSSPLSSTDYYASQTVNGCESSNRLAVAVTVNAIPSAPSGNASQTFCSGNTVANLNATGTSIQWYSGSSGGSPLNSSSVLSSTNYYASQTVNGCESSNRLQVAATVNSISTPINIVASNANCSSFDLAWDAVNCASGYKLDVSDSLSFSKSSITYSEGFESAGSFPPSGWINSSWSISSTANDINSGSYAATASSTIGSLTTKLISNPTKVTFYLGRTTNSTIKDLVIEVSTTSQTTGFITVQTFNHSNVPSNTYQKYEVDLSSYSTFSSVYIRFRKASSTTSPWRLDDIDFYTLVPYFIPNYNDKTIASNSTSITGLSPNTKYYYRVRSNDGTNTSSNSLVDSITTPALSLTTNGILSPICYNASNTTSLTYSASSDNPNSYSIDWNTAANTAGLTDQTATSFTSSTSGGTISSIVIPSNIVAGTYNGVMTITNASGCSITKNVSLTINALPAISISASPANAITCLGSSVTLTATTGLSSYAWSSGASTTNTAAFSPTATNTYSVTGTDGNGCINSATQTVNYYPASSYVGLSTSNVSGAVEQCTESNGWTYYALPSNPSQYLFGIYKNGNTFTATVDITLDNINKFRKSASSNGANQEHASYIMSRYWNATLSSGSIASNSSVKVRFFIDPLDINSLLDKRDNDYDTLKNTTNPSTFAVKSGFEWFKTVGTVYAPTNWLGNTHNGTIVKLMEDTVGTLNGQTYVELSGIMSFSGGSGGAAFGPTSNGLFNNGGVVGLPVTWHKVDVNTLENGNEVVWSTSSEQNTSHFEVEYSEDAVQFYKVSENIPAAGNSSTTQYYKFLHESEMKPWLYYRVKQVDLDGKVDYSKIIIAKRATKLPDFKVLIYPIPLIEGDLNLDIHSIAQTELQIRIIDLLGKEVHREKVPSKGYRTQHQLQLNHLPKGQYHIQIDNSIFSHQQRLILMK